MATSIDNRQRAIQLVEKLPEESLDEAIKFLNNLSKQTNQSQISILDQTEEVRKEFTRLALQWTQDVEGMSSTVEMVKHPAYQKIVSMGQVVVPFLLEDLCQNPIYWLPALRQITQQNPVKPEQRGKVKQMAEAWLSWGKQEGYIV